MSTKEFRARVQHKHKTEAQWVLDVYTDATQTTLREDPFIPLAGELIIFDKDENNEFDRIKVGDGSNNVMALPFATSSELQALDLPQEWYDINQAYENFGEPGHKLLGGLIYKDFDGNIQVYPLSPAYGVRTEECGEKLPSVVVYNSAQQILCKGPTTDNRHVVNLHYLNEIFGGGTVDVNSTKEFSIQKVPPVDTTPPIGERRPYVFCRDSENKFAGKVYSELIQGDVLVERDENGDILVNDPTANKHPVSLNYFNNTLHKYTLSSEKAWLPNYDELWQFRTPEEFDAIPHSVGGGASTRQFIWNSNVSAAEYRPLVAPHWIQRHKQSGFAKGEIYKYAKIRYLLPEESPSNLFWGLIVRNTAVTGDVKAPLISDGLHFSDTYNQVQLINDGRWHDLIFNLSAIPNWENGDIVLLRWANDKVFEPPLYIQQFGLFKSYEEAINSEPFPKLATRQWVLKNGGSNINEEAVREIVEEMLLNGEW